MIGIKVKTPKIFQPNACTFYHCGLQEVHFVVYHYVIFYHFHTVFTAVLHIDMTS